MNQAARKTRILTERFRRSTQHEPRGRGGWLFENNDGAVVLCHSGTYSEAKAAAVAYGTARGLDTLHVCP